jgi:hypothetical protein
MCTGTAWASVFAKFCAKTALIVALDAKLLEKATTKSYTATTAFGTIIFTLQTVGLVASESFGVLMQSEAPVVANIVGFFQSALNPDKQAPERCAFPTSLASKLLVEAVGQPIYALLILAAMSAPWYLCGFSCGLRVLCDARRHLSDRTTAKMQAKRLKVPWSGDGILVKGTWARVTSATGTEAPKPSAARTVSLANCDSEHIFVARSTLAAPKAADFSHNDERELSRLLRGLDMTGNMATKSEMLDSLRFHIACDDSLFDNSVMPAKLHRYQIWQACMHLLVYYFAPCTRALEVYWLCRNVAGSGDLGETQTEYQYEYLKEDMQYICWGAEHYPVMVTSVLLWAVYAILFPVTMVYLIARDKKTNKKREGDATGGQAQHANGYWHSTRPLVEQFWFPLVSHLQPQYWWFFIVEFFRKLWINFLYLRGYRADDGFNWKLAMINVLLLETCSQQLLMPRVYKKRNDTLVDLCSKQFLVAVLAVAMWSDALERTRHAEGEPLGADIDTQTPPGLLFQVVYGLPGLAPLLLHKLFKHFDRKTKPKSNEEADATDKETTQNFSVVRVHQDPPALTRLRATHQVLGALRRAGTPTRNTGSRRISAAAPVRTSTPVRGRSLPPLPVSAPPSEGGESPITVSNIEAMFASGAP